MVFVFRFVFVFCIFFFLFFFAFTVLIKTYTAAAMATCGILLTTIASVCRLLLYEQIFFIPNKIMKIKHLTYWKKCTNNSNIVVTECSPGYTGVGCSIRCSHPLFGDNCQKICMCSPEEFCDFIYGCLKSKFNLFLACAGLLYCSYMYLFVLKFMGERGKMNLSWILSYVH